jgi:hypothetical protein
VESNDFFYFFNIFSNKLVNNLWGGIASYVTYSGKKSLYDAIGEGTFEIKQNSLPPKTHSIFFIMVWSK